MKELSTINFNVSDKGVGKITLSRPEKHNAMNRQMIDELKVVASQITASHNIRLVILRAEGQTFCAGGDLNWMKEQEKKPKEGKLVEAKALATMLGSMNSLPVPLLTIVEGNAFGGGLGLIAVSDTVISASNAKFGLTETRLGLIPATIGPFVMKKLGESYGRNLFFSGKIFNARTAHKSGLVHYFCDDNQEIETLVDSEISNIMKCAPGANAITKEIVLSTRNLSREEMIQFAAKGFAKSMLSDEGMEGISSFIEKRKPKWSK